MPKGLKLDPRRSLANGSERIEDFVEEGATTTRRATVRRCKQANNNDRLRSSDDT